MVVLEEARAFYSRRLTRSQQATRLILYAKTDFRERKSIDFSRNFLFASRFEDCRSTLSGRILIIFETQNFRSSMLKYDALYAFDV